MKSGSGLVEDVQDALASTVLVGAGGAHHLARTREVRGQLHALGFSAGKRCGGLSQAKIAKTDFFEHAQLFHDLGGISEELK